jgi:anion-transporting  ArsA/GET3 family ATPase
VNLLDKRLILVCGKGGVGRSTVAAAIARRCAARGRKTLLFEANANDRFGPYFGKPAVGDQVTPLAPNLSAVNTNPQAALAEYGLMILKFEAVYEMVFENKVTRAFLRAVPGLDNYAVLGKAWFHTTEMQRGQPMWDTVVFDMPASGHSLSMLQVPSVISRTVPDGPLTRDARTIMALLRDDTRTAAVIVTIPEEMPANEALELESRLAGEAGIHPQWLIVNQVFPQRFTAGSPQETILAALRGREDTGALSDLVQHASQLAARRTLSEKYLARLAQRSQLPMVELPYLFSPEFSAEQLADLGERLEAAMSRDAQSPAAASPGHS